VDIRFLSDAGVEQYPVEDLKGLLGRGDGLVWVDIPTCDEEAARILSEVFEFHPLAVRDCAERNMVPKVHLYSDHVFVVLHSPAEGSAGHVHFIELDQFIGPGYLVTVHGPINPAVDPSVALVQTEKVLRSVESGRLRPSSSFELSFAIVSKLTGRLREYLAALTKDVWRLEQRVTAGHVGDPEEFLEELFRSRHGLLAVRTMAAHSREVYGRMATLGVFGEAQSLLDDTVDQFTRIGTMADGQREYLQGVIEFYQTRTHTKMTIAAERLAVIAAVTLPVTAVSSVIGMNVIVNDRTQPGLLLAALTLMSIMSVMLLIWAKRKGWW
jgi:Mg2+ and Co2+ transporter CorA